MGSAHDLVILHVDRPNVFWEAEFYRETSMVVNPPEFHPWKRLFNNQVNSFQSPSHAQKIFVKEEEESKYQALREDESEVKAQPSVLDG